jgi:hypothetical protein
MRAEKGMTMRKDAKKVDQTPEELMGIELSEQDLDNVVGGAPDSMFSIFTANVKASLIGMR